MLVLTRNVGDAIILPKQNIRIVVTAAGRGKARIGIEAPDEVQVVREELLETSESEAAA